MKSLFSYIIPFIKKVHSEHSGVLEITTINGKKVLDSSHANYSYGSLQKILETGITEAGIHGVNNLLVLGLGGGSIVDSLRKKFGYAGMIDAVEWDSEIIKIAASEFGITQGNNLNIFHEDANEYVKRCLEKYDLIIVDLFIDNQVPAIFYSNEFCDRLYACLNEKGKLIFNLGMLNAQLEGPAEVFSYFEGMAQMKCRFIEKVNGTNSLLLAERIQ